MKTPQQLNLPKKFDAWRPGQGELVEQIADSEQKVFLLDSPTGTGKSLVGIAVHQSRVLSTAGKEVLARLAGKSTREFERKCIYVCRTKQLQDQILREFPWAKTIKGRSNYSCLRHDGLTAEDCTHREGNPCEHRVPLYPVMKYGDDPPILSCPYFLAKARALKAPIAVLNTSYFLTEVNGPGMFAGADLLIIDEIDALESELMNYIQLRITTRQLKKFGLELPQDPHSLQGWMYWADALNLWSRIENMDLSLEQIPESQWSDIEIEQHRQVNNLKNFQNKISSFLVEVNDSWIFSEEKNDKETVWTFKPVRVDTYAEHYLWRHAKRFLGMSGTILDPRVMVDDLGIDEWDYASSSSPFPVDHRPIYYTPVVNLTRNTMVQELPKLAEAVTRIIENYPNEKVLVHTTSFFIRDYLTANLNSGRLLTHNSQNREDMLNAFMRSRHPLVMLSPSFDRGVDLPGDLCRCIVIVKVPYISMGDPQVKARMKMPGGQRWYLLKAAQTIIQMSGRGVRSEEDWCDTFILDKQFGSLLARMGKYFPGWWVEAINRG